MVYLNGVVALLLAGTAVSTQPSAPSSALPSKSSEIWAVYAGDFRVRSALNITSIRRENSIAHSQQVVVGRTGPLKAGTREFDYVLMDVDYDCDAKTETTVRANFFDRTGRLLFTDEAKSPPRPIQHVGLAQYYMDAACNPGELPPSLYRASSLKEVFGQNIWWNGEETSKP